jgi:HD-GYP domain-containing protein (c-di-GMP phosphodiesterase class II)
MFLDMDSGTLEEMVREAFEQEGVDPGKQEIVWGLLERLKKHDEPTYLHSLRVGLISRNISNFMHLQPRAALYGGELHDIGKTEILPEILGKTEGFNEKDMEIMKIHPMAGYEILTQYDLNMSARIALLHHRFQNHPYPSVEDMPPFPEVLANDCFQFNAMTASRIVSIADFYDASHRGNDRFEEASSPENIREILTKGNPDQTCLIDGLYEHGILF